MPCNQFFYDKEFGFIGFAKTNGELFRLTDYRAKL